MKDTVKAGDVVTVVGHPYKDGRPGGSIDHLLLADGRKVGTGDAIPPALVVPGRERTATATQVTPTIIGGNMNQARSVARSRGAHPGAGACGVPLARNPAPRRSSSAPSRRSGPRLRGPGAARYGRGRHGCRERPVRAHARRRAEAAASRGHEGSHRALRRRVGPAAAPLATEYAAVQSAAYIRAVDSAEGAAARASGCDPQRRRQLSRACRGHRAAGRARAAQARPGAAALRRRRPSRCGRPPGRRARAPRSPRRASGSAPPATRAPTIPTCS